MTEVVPAHDQHVTKHYLIHYPPHPPRKKDPHYRDFDAYRRRTKATAQCEIGKHRNDFSECHGGLQLHHSHVEFSLQNGVDLKWLEVDYPGISDPNSVGAWVESGDNLMWLCQEHHIGGRGIHVLSASDFEAQKFVRDLTDQAAEMPETVARLLVDPITHLYAILWRAGILDVSMGHL